jgi:hypothetical protein
MHILIGNLHYPRLPFYWDAKLCIPTIADHMPTTNRFYKLKQHVHFVNIEENTPGSKDRIWKVRPLYDSIRAKCFPSIRK